MNHLLMRHLLEEGLVANEENKRSMFGASSQLWLAGVFAHDPFYEDLLQRKRNTVYLFVSAALTMPIDRNKKGVDIWSYIRRCDDAIGIRLESSHVTIAGEIAKISSSKQINVLVCNGLAGLAVKNLNSKRLCTRDQSRCQ